MCRAKSEGGRRCTGSSSKTRWRISHYNETRLLEPFTDTGVWNAKGISATVQEAYTNAVSPDDKSRALREAKIAAMEHQGRFDILDEPFTETYRREIQEMSAAKFSEHMSCLRDHLDVDTTVNSIDRSSGDKDVERAVRVSAFMGEVMAVWLDGRTVEVDRKINDLTAEWDQKVASKLMTKADEHAFGKRFNELSREIGSVRYKAMRSVLRRLVGTDAPVDVAHQDPRTPRNFAANLKYVSDVIPNSLKGTNRSLGCVDLHVFPSWGTVSYYNFKPYGVVNVVVSEAFSIKERRHIDSQVKESVGDVTIVLPSGRRKTVKLGGRPGDVNAEREVRRSVKELNEWSGANLVLTRETKLKGEVFGFKVGKTRQGFLTAVPHRVSAQETTSSGNTLRVDARRKTVLHEMFHRVQHANPHCARIAQANILGRADGDPPVRVAEGIRKYEDHFANTYSGVIYDGGGDELLPTGIEALFGYRCGAGVGAGLPKDSNDKPSGNGLIKPDRELVSMTLGILTTAKREK